MLNYSDLTIVKNSEGIPTALGYPINSLLLKNDKSLFVGGKGKKEKKNKKETEAGNEENDTIDYEHLAVPAGLVCMTETICMRRGANGMGANGMGANAMGANAMGTNGMGTNTMGPNGMGANTMETETVPEGLYEQLLALAETKSPKKLSRRSTKKLKNKTRKRTK
jgi:hypothetical protein